MEQHEVLEQGTVVEAHDSYLTVEVEGVELFVGTTVHHTGCECCGDQAKLTVSYNKTKAHRVENHGERDPLGIL